MLNTTNISEEIYNKNIYFDYQYDQLAGGSKPEKFKDTVNLNFYYIINDNVKSEIFNSVDEFKSDQIKESDMINSIANSEERLILLGSNSNHSNNQYINLFSIIFNRNHPNFSLYLENIKSLIKESLKIISELFQNKNFKVGDYDLVFENNDYHFVKTFELDSDLSSGFINQLKLLYGNKTLSTIMKTKFHSNKDNFQKLFYYFYDSNSESEPIFALSERDFIFSKEGKMLDENYNPNKKIFEEFKSSFHLPIVSFSEIKQF